MKITRRQLRRLIEVAIREEQTFKVPSAKSSAGLEKPNMSNYKTPEIQELANQINNLQEYIRIQFATLYSYVDKIP